MPNNATLYPSGVTYAPDIPTFIDTLFANIDSPREEDHARYADAFTEDAIYEIGEWGSARGPHEILKYMEGQWARARSMKHIAEKVFPFGGEDELMLFGTVTVWTKEDGAEITVDYAGRVLLDRQNGALKIRGYYMHLTPKKQSKA
ncbi:hypothetical protein FIBSPDRAFT_869508 [Athelia psychrophila]|uniref:SnoaL-like domain-containing protein n=1 Tax=Athelia psychrophila TaxID=1759441 RepID=A0A166C1T6_9AGAM|nr:hypothetical protein FIBSPDRAFT_869508 [Fibularhizoctonia sp. CBS 109695]